MLSLMLCLSLTVGMICVCGCASTSTKESTGEYIDDSTITTKVKAKYARDPVVSAMQVKVETFKGIVQLSGFVDTKGQSDRAAELAREVEGVKDVKNSIMVKTASQ
jgi:osmotically-inducible protein OsmY